MQLTFNKLVSDWRARRADCVNRQSNDGGVQRHCANPTAPILILYITSVVLSLYSDMKLVDTGVEYELAAALDVQMKLRLYCSALNVQLARQGKQSSHGRSAEQNCQMALAG